MNNGTHIESLALESLETVTGGLGISGKLEGSASGSIGRVTGFNVQVHPTVCLEVGGHEGCVEAKAELGAGIELYKKR